ncbi:MAG: surface lipoprotein assembly modifier [Pseudohongiella sp.]
MKTRPRQFSAITPCHSATALLLLATSIGSGIAAAQTDEAFTLSGSLEAGAEYNSNVSVSELESATGESDTAGNLDAGIDANWQASDRLSVDAGYSYSAQRYQDFNAFDLDLHLLYGDVSYEFDQFSIGSNYYLADAQLGGDDFLTLKQYSFYAGKLFADQWFLRGALNFADKSFDDFAQRNADTEGLSLDAFWFFNQGRSTLVFGFSHDDEQTQDPAFSYDADTLRLRYTNRFSLLGNDTEFRLGTRFQDRNYQAATPGLGARRNDRQHVTDARLEMSLTDYLAVATQIERGDYQSNLSSADYTENRASVSLKLTF